MGGRLEFQDKKLATRNGFFYKCGVPRNYIRKTNPLTRQVPISMEWMLSQSDIDPITGCWNWKKSKNAGGYARLGINGKVNLAARVVLRLSVSEPPSPKHLACHTCDNPGCINPNHLFWGTSKDNTQDALRKGRMGEGVNHYKSNLNTSQVHEIRRRAPTECQAALAREFKVQPGTVCRIVSGKAYKNVPKEALS